MSLEKFTFWGICQFDPTILDAITLPAPLDREILIDEIMKRSGSLFVYHQQPEYLKRNISNWFRRNEFNFKKQIEALQAEFDPVENYNRIETYKESGSDSLVSTAGKGSTTTRSGSDTVKNTGSDSSTTQVSAFNSSDFENSEKTTNALGTNQETILNDSTTLTTRGQDSDVTTYGKQTDSHIHGNIGTTQAPDMIKNAIDLYSFDLYENIAERFEKEFLVQIY